MMKYQRKRSMVCGIAIESNWNMFEKHGNDVATFELGLPLAAVGMFRLKIFSNNLKGRARHGAPVRPQPNGRCNDGTVGFGWWGEGWSTRWGNGHVFFIGLGFQPSVFASGPTSYLSIMLKPFMSMASYGRRC